MRLILALALLLPGLALADADPPRPVPPPATGPALEVAGAAEVVFDWTTDRCYEEQIPDLPVRAYRDAEGQVNLILSHTSAHRMRGPDFDSLLLDCSVLMGSAHDPDPSHFANHEWIASVYTEDGIIVHALIHNEFQGNRYPQLCPSGEYFRCWYNTITYARSTDGGASFARPIAPPDHLAAALTTPYAPDEGIFGAFSPSNIIAYEGAFYAFFKVQTYPLETQYVCLMRTETLADPESWRFWNGVGFTGVFADPYRDDLQAMRATNCSPVGLSDIAQMYENVTWNTHLNRFVMIGTSSDPARDPNLFGFYYALSEDLIHWTPRHPLLEARLPWRATGNQTVYLYPTLIDPESDSRNFETTGAEAWLYFTRLNYGSGHLDRDLLRVPVRFRAAE
ncbi:hypothetical protein E2K80_02275 [Rhodophyticola sp. CCM32]|uniref:hypothetical protein n=1 Tax=Rhodophyticola sp. CCM32 TaxID=2916397 RepID=UPI00107F2F15|nr:hypothetical protein [Rhodophyticola sp. CCM32]QBX99693.1 hypothetical protein E2K80_02275 [Rhodophyticola sp. CCM32]